MIFSLLFCSEASIRACSELKSWGAGEKGEEDVQAYLVRCVFFNLSLGLLEGLLGDLI